MKKLVLMAVVCLFTTAAQSQDLPNIDFEDWHMDTGYIDMVEMPEGWLTTGWGDMFDEPVLKDTDAYSGNYAPKLIATTADGYQWFAGIGVELVVEQQSSRYLNGFFKGDFDPETDTLWVEAAYYDDQNDSFYVVGAFASDVPDTWEPFHLDVNANVGWDTLYLSFNFWGEEGNYILLDSVYFSEDSAGASLGPSYVKTSSIKPAGRKHISHLKAYPNPANEQTTLEFVIWERSNVTVKLYDLSGRELKTIADNQSMNGPQKLSVSTSDLQNGIYLCTINTGKKLVTQKIVVNR